VLKASAVAIPLDLCATTFALAVDLVPADGRLEASKTHLSINFRRHYRLTASWLARSLMCC
jgi:hypothetical protein